MRIKDGFMLREIAGSWVVVPLGARVVEFNGLISLTETSAFIWRLMEQGLSNDEILQKILADYDIDEETARQDIDEFVKSGIEKGLFIA